MITEHEKFRLKDQNGKHDLIAEVNWNPEDEATNNSQVLRFTWPDGTKSFVKREYLNAMLFAIGTAADQRKMIPQKIHRSRWYETVISVEAKNDIKKGEKITFPLKITLPTFEQEVVAELQTKLHKQGKILKPDAIKPMLLP
jgi:hypothetical protein